MKEKLIKRIILQSVAALAISVTAYFLLDAKLIAGLIFVMLMVAIVIKPGLLAMNWLVIKTNWYNKKTGDVHKFRKNIPYDLEICNLGSTSGKYAFDYENTGLKGENWALSPQTLAYDYRVLKNYFSYLKDGATVLIPLCPFSSCIIDFEDDRNNYKYYAFLHPILILNYSPETSAKARRFVEKPFRYAPIQSMIRLVFDAPKDGSKSMDTGRLKENADLFIKNWKEQFEIDDLDAPVSHKNMVCVRHNMELLKEMVAFCLERSLKPVFVLPPVHSTLGSQFSEEFRKNYIYSFVEDACGDQIKFLNYFDDERFSDSTLYLNSAFLNQKGRELFTHRVLSDLALT